MHSEQFETLLLQEHFSQAVLVERQVGYSLGVHEHPFDACALVTQGAITLVVDGVGRTYAAGEIFRLAAGTPHLENAGPEGVSYLAGRRQHARGH